MRPLAEMSRATWWAFAVAAAAAIVAAAVTALSLVPATMATGAWQLVAGIALTAAMARAWGGLRPAIPFVGAAAVGLVLGAAGVLFSTPDPGIALLAIGMWAVVAGAGYLAVSRIAASFRVPEGGLVRIAWASIGVGVVSSTLPAFKLGASVLVVAAALAATGAITALAALRLRVLPDEAPPVLSKREARRAGRGSPGR
jgi:hypothetical protein